MDADRIDSIKSELQAKVGKNKIAIIKIANLALKSKKALAAGDVKAAKSFVDQMNQAAKVKDPTEPEPVKLKAPGQDLSHDKAVALKKVEDPIVAGKKEMSSITGSIANILQDKARLQSKMKPDEFGKFEDEIQLYKQQAAELANLIKAAQDIKQIQRYDNIAKSYVNYVRNNLHRKYENALSTGYWRESVKVEPTAPVVPGQEPVAAAPAVEPEAKTREASLADLQGDVNDWFASKGIDISQFGTDPDAQLADDPEGNEFSADPKELDKMARNEDYGTRIRRMMSESFDKSYKEATKKLI